MSSLIVNESEGNRSLSQIVSKKIDEKQSYFTIGLKAKRKHIRRQYLGIVDTGRCEATFESGCQPFLYLLAVSQPYGVDAILPVPTAISCLAYLFSVYSMI